MTLAEAAAMLAAGFGAGTINAVIGSGTLITFPVLLALGYPAVTANVSNTLGLVPGSAAAVVGYRAEIAGQRRRALGLAAFTAGGAVLGAVLLLTLPDDLFEVIVPVLIGLALVLVVFQPRISAWVLARRDGARPDGGRGLRAGIAGIGVYGGYFGAGQGILLFALLANGVDDELQNLNALRNLLAGTANAVGALCFVVLADIDYGVAGVIAAGAITGGYAGARIGRRLSPDALRGVVVLVGLAAIVQLVVG